MRTSPASRSEHANTSGPDLTSHLWHATDVLDARKQLETTDDGLDDKEVAHRRARWGPNEVSEPAQPSTLLVFLRQFATPLILILVVAAVVTIALGEWLDTALIAVALMLNAVIGFTQERRAASAVQALMRLVVFRSRVIRGGHHLEVDSRDLVPGDLVVIESGTRVPADLRLTTVHGLNIDESLLTGESLPVAKSTTPVDPGAFIADQSCMAFAGSIVTSGRGHGLVVAIGDATALGEIAVAVQREDPTRAPLHARLQRFARLVGVAILIASIVTFVSGVAMGESMNEMFHAAVAMAVSAVPEGLPVAVTVTQAIGVSRMARRNAVLRRLAAVETLGSTTVIGSDKTGTLTQNRMEVQRIWTGDGSLVAPEHVGNGDVVHRLTLLAGVFANDAEVAFADDGPVATGDPTEVALLLAAASAGIDPEELRDRHEVIATIPFESDRRYSASIRDYEGGHAVFVKGAPERVIDMCTSMLTADGPVPIDADAARASAHELATEGLRVLAFAYRQHHPDACPHRPHDEPEDLVLVGMQGMMDPPRSGVRDAIDACRDAGVRVLMITGDHAVTARAIATRLGIVDSDDAPVLTGEDLAMIDRDHLRERVRDVSVFARVSPNDKLRIVRALQDDGEVVAVTGDGVNDAPALRAAAIGVAMGKGGTDVAREASEMVLSDDNFVSIVAAIESGRVAFANIRKVSFFLISTALAETAAIMMSVWLGWPLLLLPAQILWLNLVTNGVQDLALAFEPGSGHVLKRPPRPRREGILSPLMWERTVLTGLIMAAGALVMFNWQMGRSDSLVAAQSVALTTLVAFNIFQAGNARSENRSLFTLSPFSNPFLFWATLGAICLHIGALHFPPTQNILGVEPISAAAWARIIPVAATILVAIEIHKAIRRRWPIAPRSGTRFRP